MASAATQEKPDLGGALFYEHLAAALPPRSAVATSGAQELQKSKPFE
jgi:hypothetical protein